MTPRIAVVGAGPAGAYAAAELLAGRLNPEVDVFDRLPTPWGLLRGGVAPDHQEIKTLAKHFSELLVRPGCRFIGGVEIGADIHHADLAEHYDAVIYAIGARSSRPLGIEGEDLAGVVPTTDVVGWYNGSPDHRELELGLDGVRRAVIIGNGNVAADVARVLTRPADQMGRTDIADHALEQLRTSAIEEVVVVGRRGPAQAAFTSAELHDLVNLDGVDVVVEPGEVALDELSQQWLQEEGGFTPKRNVSLLGEAAERGAGDAPRRIVLRFLRSPVRINGDGGRVTSIDIARNELSRDESGTLRARTTDDVETIECQLVMPSVGYQAVPLPDVPFDGRAFVLPNELGRVVDPESREPVPGVYAVGWIKRGPTGILGTNKRDARETVACVVEDLTAGRGLQPQRGTADAVDALLAERSADVVDFDGWAAIDAAETAAGEAQERPRVKLTTVADLRAAARA